MVHKNNYIKIVFEVQENRVANETRSSRAATIPAPSLLSPHVKSTKRYIHYSHSRLGALFVKY